MSTDAIIGRIKEHYSRECEKDPSGEMPKYRAWHSREGLIGWEDFFVPEEEHYETVMGAVKPDDVVFDIGAGDLRLDLMLCEKVKRVYAVEINPVTLAGALQNIGFDMPKNLITIRGNAFDIGLPLDTTFVLCLMIHRQHEIPTEWLLGRASIVAHHDGLWIREAWE